jgi:hypothetical protein
MKRTHLLIELVAPNESDPEGYEYSLCNTDKFDGVEGTHRWNEANCKRCLKLIKKREDKLMKMGA